MLKITAVIIGAIMVAGCNQAPNLEPEGKAMFDAVNKTMLGYKLYSKIDDIKSNSKYSFLKKEDLNDMYKVETDKNDPRHVLLSIGVRDTKIYAIQSMYEYPNFAECNKAAEKLFIDNKERYQMQQRTNISNKGYHFDGVARDVAFITACTDLVVPKKVVHSTYYIDLR